MEITFSREEVEQILIAAANDSLRVRQEAFNTIKTDSYMTLPSVTVWYEAPTPAAQENEAL